MSKLATHSITCPSCGSAGQVQQFQSVNVTLYPEQQRKLFSGELLKWTCESCQYTAYMQYPLLYHDMHRRLMMLWFPYEDRLTEASITEVMGPWPPSDPTLQGYRYRIVPSLDDLREKASVFEAGLDDRAFERVKGNLIDTVVAAAEGDIAAMLREAQHQPRFAHVQGEGQERRIALAYPALTKVPGGEAIPAGMLYMQMPLAAYEAALASLGAEPGPAPLYGPFLLCNRIDGAAGKVADSAGPGNEQVTPPAATKPWWRFW